MVNITGWRMTNINVYFDVGLPKGYDTIIRAQSLTLSPKLVGISPNSGSLGSSVISATIQGLGPLTNSSAAFWAANGGTLVDASTGASICSKVWITEYSKVKCRTYPGVYSASTLIAAKSYLTSETLECVGGNTTAACLYQQLASSNFPEVSSISNSVSNKVVFTGTNFFTSGYTGNASYGGVNADTVVIDSAT